MRSTESKIAQKSTKKKVKTIWHDNIDISKLNGSIFSKDMGSLLYSIGKSTLLYSRN